MLNGELKRRTHKLEQEQKARLEADRRRAERERIVEDRVRAKRQVEEEEASRRRAAAIAEAELVSPNPCCMTERTCRHVIFLRLTKNPSYCTQGLM